MKNKPGRIRPQDHNSLRSHCDDFVMAPDFDPDALLEQVLQGRKVEEGISVDSARTEIIDDGFWIVAKPAARPNARTGGWIIKTMIADMAAMMPEGSALSNAVNERFKDKDRITGQMEKRHIRTFPHDYINRYASLHEGAVRPVLAFTMEISPDYELVSYEIKRAAFRNTRKCSLDPLQAQVRDLGVKAQDWYNIAHKIREKRLNNMAGDCDAIAEPFAANLRKYTVFPMKSQHQGEVMVQELMRMTSAVALDYALRHGLAVPTRTHPAYFNVMHHAKDPMFDRACEATARDVLRRYNRSRPGKIRLTSPMQKYSDYVTMCVIADHLDGKPAAPELAAEARRLTCIFNEAAGDNIPHLQQYQQNPAHPFDILTGHPDDEQAVRLDAWSRQNGYDRPDVSIHRLTVQGGYCYLVGIEQKFSVAQGYGQRAWGIALDYEGAREIAAFRLMGRIQGRQPRPSQAPSNQP